MEEFKVEDLNEDDSSGTTSEECKAGEAEGGDAEQEKKVSPVKEVLSWVFTFAAAILVSFFVKEYIIINADVPTGSMENTIMPGDRLIGNRLAYIKEGPERGDVVVFRYPDDEDILYVKRVIGLPGETVVIQDGKVYIDGEELEETYLKEEWTVATGPYIFEVPEGCYLMLGDNRNNSKDARYWDNTYVALDKILGKALFVYWPLSDFGSLGD